MLLYRDPGQEVDGIRDHGQALATALQSQGEEASLVLVDGPRDIARVPAADAYLVQYNPFAWGRRGMAPRLARAMRNLGRRPGRPTVALMVHEPFMSLTGVRPRLMGVWQRLQLADVLRAAHVTFVSIEPWVEPVRRWAPDAPIHVLPVGSNLPDMRAERPRERARLQVSDDSLVVALFGTGHPSRLMGHAQASVEALVDAGHEVLVLNLGWGAPELRGLRDSVPVITPGRQPAGEVARMLSAADLFLAPFVDGVSTRRTTFMSALQHELPVVGTYGPSTDEGLKSLQEALALVPVERTDLFVERVVSLADLPKARRALGGFARMLYERDFDWPVVARMLTTVLRDHRRKIT